MRVGWPDPAGAPATRAASVAHNIVGWLAVLLIRIIETTMGVLSVATRTPLFPELSEGSGKISQVD